MANRFWVGGNGDWDNSTTHWSGTSGGAGGASVPGVSDTAVLNTSATVTIKKDIVVSGISHTAGTLNFGSYTTTVATFESKTTTARTINMDSANLIVNCALYSGFSLSDSNLTFNAGTSLITLNLLYGTGFGSFITLSKNFNDVKVNLGGGGSATTLNIYDSPTIRSLDIVSLNSEAHSVNLATSSTVNVRKLTAIGASNTNKITIQPSSGTATINFLAGGSSYGSNIKVSVYATGAGVPKYIGSGADVTPGTGWLAQNSPLASTLVDEFDGASLNSGKWTTSTAGTATATVTGGQLTTGWTTGSTSYVDVSTTDTYDLVSEIIYVDVASVSGESQFISIIPVMTASESAFSVDVAVTATYHRIRGVVSGANVAITFERLVSDVWTSVLTKTYTQAQARAVRFSISGSRNTGSSSLTLTSVGVPNIYPPTVTTGATTAITDTSATAAGNVTSDGNATVTERGIVYSTSPVPTTTGSKITVAGTTGSFSGSLTGLTENTKYYVRAYAINSKGTAYGSELNFTTTVTFSAVTGTAGTPILSSVAVTGSKVNNPNSYSLTEYGVAYGTATSPTIADNKQTSTDPITGYDVTLTGLTEATTYYARAYATYSGVTRYGSQISFKTTGRPVVTLDTGATTNDLKPQLRFTGNDPDSNDITYQLQFNPTNSFTSPLYDKASATDSGFTNLSTARVDPFYSGNQIGYTIPADLTRGASYYWRVRGKDVTGSNTWGEWTAAKQLTVSALAPSVSIDGIIDILDTTLKVNGTIVSDGGASVTERGAVLSLSPNPTTADIKQTATGSPFTAAVTGLTSSTTYYVRTYAINSTGTSYSTQTTVMTLQPLAPPTLTVNDAANIRDTVASVTAQVTLDGKRTITERGVVFGLTTNPTTVDNRVTDILTGLGEYTLSLTGLQYDTTYNYRAYAINDQGVGYSANKTFKTLPEFVPDQGDGYWTFSNTGSTAVVSRSQATPINSSANLALSELPQIIDGETYTLHVGNISADFGDPKLSLLYYTGAVPTTVAIPANSEYTFTYDLTTYNTYNLVLTVTQGTAATDPLTATFADLYLAKEDPYTSFVEYVPRGITEVKIENNQIVDKRRQDVITSIYDKLLGFSYTPFEVTTEGLGYFEIGDSILITDDQARTVKAINYDSILTIDGGISESLKGTAPGLKDTDYSKAGNIKKLISNTTLQVDKQSQQITALVSDVYDNDGYIEEKFSQVQQTINEVKTTVQGAGGVNLVRNSVMYAYNNLGFPDSWTSTFLDPAGSIVIQGSAESRAAGGLSGNAFTLKAMKTVQRVTVRKDVDFVADDQKTKYTFSLKVKKNLVGAAYIKLSNRNETRQIDLETGTAYYWENIVIEALLPQDSYYDIELGSDMDASAQFTDVMLSVGESTHSWTQAAGEVGNANVSITEEGITLRQDQFRYNYTKMDALGFEVHKKVLGSEKQIFGFNGDETNVPKLRADEQIQMGNIRIVPIAFGGESGWAFTVGSN